MQGFANRPYSPVFSVFSMTSRVSVLHRYVANCRLSMHEKGKKRAKCCKSLIRGSLISATVRHFISVVQAQFESASGEAIESHLKLLVPTVARPRWRVFRSLPHLLSIPHLHQRI